MSWIGNLNDNNYGTYLKINGSDTELYIWNGTQSILADS
jgi:hypothetical protein